MKRFYLLITGIILQFFISNYVVGQHYKAITGGTVIKTTSPGQIDNATILLQDNKIIAVGKSGKVKIPVGADIIDAKGKYIIPGLIDGHIHFFQSGGLYTRPDGLDLQHRVPYKQEIQWIKDNLDDVFKRYIRCGITTVVDFGGPYWNFAVRDSSLKTNLAPRVFTTGPLIASWSPDVFMKAEDRPIIQVNTVDEALQLVRKEVEKKPDFIKIWYVIGRGKTAEGFYTVVKAIVDESHRLGYPVFIHATELYTAKKAIQAGCDVLAHNVRDSMVDEEFLKLAKSHKVILVPTAWVFESYAAVYTKQLHLMKVEQMLGNPKVIGTLFDMYDLADSELGERQKKLLKENKPVETSPVVLYNIKKMQDYGITLAAGTDAGNVGVIHGPGIFHEFAIMSKAGLTNYQILIDATLNGAKLLKKEKELGSVEAGKLADLVILNSNPLENIQNTIDINLVIKDGKIFKPGEVLKYTPEDLVQIQLNAYNSRDLEAYLSVFSDSVEVYTFPNQLQNKGKAKMRELYTGFFTKATYLHCKLENRGIMGNYVTDFEDITTNIPGKEKFKGQAIYEVKGDKIVRVWFVK